MFTVEARNAQGELVCLFTNYYKNGSGGWFEFDPVVSGLLAGIESGH